VTQDKIEAAATYVLKRVALSLERLNVKGLGRVAQIAISFKKIVPKRSAT
jgi:hypothetical protein